MRSREWWDEQLSEYIKLINVFCNNIKYLRIKGKYLIDEDNAYIVLDSAGPYIILHFQDATGWDDNIEFVGTIEYGEFVKILKKHKLY